MHERAQRLARLEPDAPAAPTRADAHVRPTDSTPAADSFRERMQFSLLEVGAVDDPAEAEADRVASAVVAKLSSVESSASSRARRAVAGGTAESVVGHSVDGEPVEHRVQRGGRASSPSGADSVAAVGPITAGRVQRSAHAPAPVSPDIGKRLDRIRRAAGAPLPDAVRSRMEPVFGIDLSGVRVHEGGQVRRAADDLHARAFTVGQDVYFRDRVPTGRSAADVHLMAHELTHTLQQRGGGQPLRRNTGGPPVLTDPDRRLAQKVAAGLANEILEDEVAYVFRGLGGKGASWRRSTALKKFRRLMKTEARLKAFEDLDATALDRTGDGADSPTADFEQLIGGNIAYDEVKSVIRDQLDEEARRIVASIDVAASQSRIKWAAQRHLLHNTGDWLGAIKQAKAQAKLERVAVRAELKRRKDAVVGKGESALDEGVDTTGAGTAMIQNVVDRVDREEIGRKSLEKAYDAPTVNKGMKILGKLIDNIIPGAGETVELKVAIKIPTGTPGLTVDINVSGLAARGVDGATTAGVTVLGDPKRVEVAAKLSLGVGAEAIGLSSSGSVGIFVRAGSDAGTEAALQALSYGAYRGAPVEAFANLWAPEDKATEVRKAANKKAAKSGNALNLPERTKRQRAEMWAAMIEEKYFSGTGTGTFADVGMSIDGGLNVNAGVAKVELAFGESIFSHYDEELLRDKLGDRFASRVLDDAGAKGRRKDATGEKKLALSGSLGLKIGAGPSTVELALSVSGGGAQNWGVEIVGGASTASDATSPTEYDKIMNGWVTGLAEMIKKLRDVAGKQLDDDSTGAIGALMQMTADTTALFDVGHDMGIREAMASATESVSASTPGVSYETAIGGTQKAVTKASALAASTMFQFVLTFGVNGGKRVVRIELRSKRGIDIGGGSPVTVSASKTTRLFAIGKELDGEVHAEILGGRT